VVVQARVARRMDGLMEGLFLAALHEARQFWEREDLAGPVPWIDSAGPAQGEGERGRGGAQPPQAQPRRMLKAHPRHAGGAPEAPVRFRGKVHEAKLGKGCK